MKKERDLLPDIIRGFAIIMVVLGHCIQEGNGADFSTGMLYFNDKFYHFIYSFHMPLFALIAGYYAYPGLSRCTNIREQFKLLIRRILTYGIPIIVWTLFEYIRECIINIRLGYITFNFVTFMSGLPKRIITNHWFLWAMIICFVVVWIMHVFFRDNIILYGIGYIALFFIPDGLNFHTYKYLLPFYVVAFYVNQHKEQLPSVISSLIKRNRLLLLLSFISFIILFAFYKSNALIYVSGYRITKNIWWQMIIIDVYRMFIGFVGSIFWISLWKELTLIFKNYKFPILTAFGRNSLGVYLISGYSTILIMRRFTDNLSYSIPRVLLETIIIGFASLIISVIISKIPIIKKSVGK